MHTAHIRHLHHACCQHDYWYERTEHSTWRRETKRCAALELYDIIALTMSLRPASFPNCDYLSILLDIQHRIGTFDATVRDPVGISV